MCKNGYPQVLGELFEKKLLPGVKNSVKFEYQHYILSFYCFIFIFILFYCFMLALCTKQCVYWDNLVCTTHFHFYSVRPLTKNSAAWVDHCSLNHLHLCQHYHRMGRDMTFC